MTEFVIALGSGLVGFVFGAIFVALVNESEVNGYGLSMNARKAKRGVKQAAKDKITTELKYIYTAIDRTAQQGGTATEAFVRYPENVAKLKKKGFMLRELVQNYFEISWKGEE